MCSSTVTRRPSGSWHTRRPPGLRCRWRSYRSTGASSGTSPSSLIRIQGLHRHRGRRCSVPVRPSATHGQPHGCARTQDRGRKLGARRRQLRVPGRGGDGPAGRERLGKVDPSPYARRCSGAGYRECAHARASGVPAPRSRRGSWPCSPVARTRCCSASSPAWRPGQAREQMDAVKRRSGLAEHYERLVASYSQGMRARLGLAVVEGTEPTILLLDEVHEALDHEFRDHLEQYVEVLLARGGIVVATGHDHPMLRSGSARARCCSSTAIWSLTASSPTCSGHTWATAFLESRDDHRCDRHAGEARGPRALPGCCRRADCIPPDEILVVDQAPSGPAREAAQRRPCCGALCRAGAARPGRVADPRARGGAPARCSR